MNNDLRHDSPRDFGLLLIRVMVGVVMMFHGAQKLFGMFDGMGMAKFTGFLEAMQIPMPQVSAYMAAGAEFFGGLLLVIGLLTRLSAAAVAFTMFVAAFKAHGHAFSLEHKGMEYALTLGVVAVGLMLTGAGQFSLDAMMFRRRNHLTDTNG